MQFNDTQKQAEFDAFKTYCEVVAKRPFSAVKRTLMSTIQSIAAGQYGAGAAKEISAVFRTLTAAPRTAEPGKGRGEGRQRHSPTPEQNLSPEMRDLLQRREQRAGQESKSEASELVVVDDPAVTVDEVVIPAEGEYTRQEMIDFLTSQGVDADFEGKTDRQLKNLVKKHSV